MPDLWKEFIKHGRKEFTANGVTTNAISDEALPLAYLNWLKRAVSAMPRKIHRSNKFSCPPECVDGLAEIERKIAIGETLRPHLSTRITNPTYNDPMLNDWGIYHLHLGRNLQSNGFVERTGQLLYARFDGPNAYLLGIVPHHGLWTLKDMIQVMHENWPSTIERYRVKGIASNDAGHTDNEHAAIRNHSANALIHIAPGIVYTGPGGGLTSSGTGMETLRLHDFLQLSVQDMENHIKSERGKTLPTNPDVRLVVERKGNKLTLIANILNNNAYLLIGSVLIG